MLETIRIHESSQLAVADESSAMTYGEFHAFALQIVSLLESAKAPLIIYIALPNGPLFSAIHVAAIESGCVAVPLSPKLTPSEASKYFDAIPPDLVVLKSRDSAQGLAACLPSRATIIIADGGQHRPEDGSHLCLDDIQANPSLLQSSLHLRARFLPRGVSTIQFTSGTTGDPKAILLGKANILANQRQSLAQIRTYSGADAFIPVPQFHAMGNALVLEHLLAGVSVHMANDQMFGSHLKRMAGMNIASVHASPTYFRLLLRMRTFSQDHLPAVRSLVIGSDWSDNSLLSELRRRFPDADICCRYGSSEAFGAIAYSIFPKGIEISSRTPAYEVLPGIKIGAVNEHGEDQAPVLRIASPTVADAQMLPDRRLSPLRDADGFLDTGDTFQTADGGRFVLVGRESQFIKFNGYRISPYEIEDVLRRHPGVRDAAVAGIPDSVTGQRIIACVELDETGGIDEARLRTHCAQHLSMYKIPGVFVFGATIPRTPAGKIARRELSNSVVSMLERRP